MINQGPATNLAQIRDKRLARLARLGGPSSSKPAATPPDGGANISQPVGQQNEALGPQPQALPIPGAPTSQVPDRSSNSATEGVATSPLPEEPLLVKSSQIQPAAGNPPSGALAATEAWEDKALRQIFRVALEVSICVNLLYWGTPLVSLDCGR